MLNKKQKEFCFFFLSGPNLFRCANFFFIKHSLFSITDDIGEVNKFIPNWLMEASRHQASNPATLNPFKKEKTLVTEIDGTPSRNFFTILNVGKYFQSLFCDRNTSHWSKRRPIVFICACRHHRPARWMSANQCWNDTVRVLSARTRLTLTKDFSFLLETEEG